MILNETISTPNAPSPVALHGAAIGAWHSMTASTGPDVVAMAAGTRQASGSTASRCNLGIVNFNL
jgi:hypothetical protein